MKRLVCFDKDLAVMETPFTGRCFYWFSFLCLQQIDKGIFPSLNQYQTDTPCLHYSIVKAKRTFPSFSHSLAPLEQKEFYHLLHQKILLKKAEKLSGTQDLLQVCDENRPRVNCCCPTLETEPQEGFYFFSSQT